MGHIQRSHLQAVTASCPPDAALTGFCDGALGEAWDFVSAGVSCACGNSDLLLPKLMSGGIRIREGEQITGDVS